MFGNALGNAVVGDLQVGRAAKQAALDASLSSNPFSIERAGRGLTGLSATADASGAQTFGLGADAQAATVEALAADSVRTSAASFNRRDAFTSLNAVFDTPLDPDTSNAELKDLLVTYQSQLQGGTSAAPVLPTVQVTGPSRTNPVVAFAQITAGIGVLKPEVFAARARATADELGVDLDSVLAQRNPRRVPTANRFSVAEFDARIRAQDRADARQAGGFLFGLFEGAVNLAATGGQIVLDGPVLTTFKTLQQFNTGVSPYDVPFDDAPTTAGQAFGRQSAPAVVTSLPLGPLVELAGFARSTSVVRSGLTAEAVGLGRVANSGGKTVTLYRVDDAGFAPRIASDGSVPVVATKAGNERALFVNIGQPERAKEFALVNRGGNATVTAVEVDASLLERLRATSIYDRSPDVGLYPNAPLRVDINKAPDQFGLRTPEHFDWLREAIKPNTVRVIDPKDL